MSARMTGKQMDALERRWKFILFCLAVMLMLDLVYLGVLRPRGGAKAICLLTAAALLGACIYAMRQLHGSRFSERNPETSSDELCDLPTLSLFDSDD
jgi:hypothetical protein